VEPPTHTFLRLSRVPPHERLLNGAITSVCRRLANHSFSSNFWKAGLRPHVLFQHEKFVPSRWNPGEKCNMHPYVQIALESTDVLSIFKYRQLMRSTWRIRLAWTKQIYNTQNSQLTLTVKFESCCARMDKGSRNKPINRALDTQASRSNCWKKHKRHL